MKKVDKVCVRFFFERFEILKIYLEIFKICFKTVLFFEFIQKCFKYWIIVFKFDKFEKGESLLKKLF